MQNLYSVCGCRYRLWRMRKRMQNRRGVSTKARATPFVSMSVPVSVIRTCVRHFEPHLATTYCLISHGFDLIWRDITLTSWKMTSIWCFYHLCLSLKRSYTFPSVYGNGLTDAEIRTLTGIAYSMQCNGLLPLTDTGTRTWVHGHGQV